MQMDKNIGQKLYRVNDNNELEIVRIIKISDNEYILDNGNKMSQSQLDTDYVMLNGDGLLSFNIVQLGKNEKSKDVIVTLHRKDDIKLNNNIPYMACRQCIYDSFASVGQKFSDNIYMGLSMTQDNCPENVPFNSMLACDGLIYSEVIKIYMDDSLDTILSLINVDKYDEVLNTMFKQNELMDNNVYAYASSLKELLEMNYFMYDFRQSYKIESMPIETLSYDNESKELYIKDKEIISEILRIKMFRTYVMEFSKEIDLDEIKRSYVLIATEDNKVYIIGYDKGKFINNDIKKNLSEKQRLVQSLKYR